MAPASQKKMNEFFAYLNTVRNNRAKHEPTKHRRSLGGSNPRGSGSSYKKASMSNRMKTAVKKLKSRLSRK